MASHELPPPRKYPGFVDRLPGRGFQRLMIAKHINCLPGPGADDVSKIGVSPTTSRVDRLAGDPCTGVTGQKENQAGGIIRHANTTKS